MTGDFSNGRLWNVLNSGEKTIYVQAFIEGLSASGVERKIIDEYTASAATVGEAKRGIDQFYQKPENLALPIFFALRTFTDKVKGVPAADIDAKLAAVRKYYSSIVVTPATPDKEN